MSDRYTAITVPADVDEVRTRMRYPLEFRRYAAQLATSPGQTVKKVARDLDLNQYTLRNWVTAWRENLRQGKKEADMTDMTQVITTEEIRNYFGSNGGAGIPGMLPPGLNGHTDSLANGSRADAPEPAQAQGAQAASAEQRLDAAILAAETAARMRQPRPPAFRPTGPEPVVAQLMSELARVEYQRDTYKNALVLFVKGLS
jgi:transposase